MNSNLSSLVTSVNSLLSSNGIGYIGKTVEAIGDTTSLQSGSATWKYSLSGDATSATINVKDENGNSVYSTSGESTSGNHTFTWDGTTSSGTKLTSGNYTIEVTAKNSSGTSVLNSTSIVGQVTGIDSSSGTTLLSIGDVTVAMNTVTNVQS